MFPKHYRCTTAHPPIPETMVNLEVWMKAGFNMESWVKHRLVADAGPLGPTGRYVLISHELHCIFSVACIVNNKSTMNL